MGGVVPRFHTASWSSPNLLGSTMKSRGWKRGGTDAPGLWTGPGMSPLAYPVTSPGLVADIRGQNLVSGAGHLHCVRVEAVLLADADVPLLVEFGRQDGTTGELEVTHLEAIRSQRSDDVEPQRDEEPAAGDATAPPVTASDPLHLVLSHEQVASTGQTITLAVVNASDSEFSYGADGALERWDGAAWEEVADVVLSRTWWESGGGVAGPENPNLALPDIQYSAPPGGAGEPEWLTLPMLDTGWYRLVRGGGSRQAMAVFRVVAVDEPLEPVLAVPWEDSYLSLDVAAIGPAGGLLDMVPAEGSEVTGRPHGEDIERAAQLSRWEQGEWTSSRGAALDLDPDEPVGNTRAVRVSIPQLDPGFWRSRSRRPTAGSSPATSGSWISWQARAIPGRRPRAPASRSTRWRPKRVPSTQRRPPPSAAPTRPAR